MRLFTAITLDAAIKAALSRVQQDLSQFGKAVRLVTEDQMHLTIKFLGEVSDGDVQKVTEAVREIAGQCSPFEFGIGGLGCFPPRGAVRVVWVGVVDASGLLEACHQASEAAFDRIGFAKEKRGFSPHLTLGRVKNPKVSGQIRKWLDGRSFDAGTQAAEQLTLYQSLLSSKGATYQEVMRADFKPAEFGK